jgi:hypothetical protein
VSETVARIGPAERDLLAAADSGSESSMLSVERPQVETTQRLLADAYTTRLPQQLRQLGDLAAMRRASSRVSSLAAARLF